MEGKVRVRMLPVCECGYIFESLQLNHDNEVYLSHYTAFGCLKTIIPFFDPYRCPKCGQRIEAVEVSSDLVNMIRKEK